MTKKVLEEARQAGVRRVWLQPGSFDRGLLEGWEKDGGFESLVAGWEGLRKGGEGWCVLVHGEGALEEGRGGMGEREREREGRGGQGRGRGDYR